jgi:hypothetical protein
VRIDFVSPPFGRERVQYVAAEAVWKRVNGVFPRNGGGSSWHGQTVGVFLSNPCGNGLCAFLVVMKHREGPERTQALV